MRAGDLFIRFGVIGGDFGQKSTDVAWSLGDIPEPDSDAIFAARDGEGDYGAGPSAGDPFDDNYDDIPF